MQLKRAVPQLKLGYLIFAAAASDFLCGIFLPTGIEGVDAAGAMVFSHWVLDFISHPTGMGRKLPPGLPGTD